MKRTSWPGNWKVTCHVCGFWFPSSEIKHRWDGLLVCKKDYETRHPQTLIKVHGETAVPAFVSKDTSPDPQTALCNIATSSGYAGLGTAECMQAGNNTYPYSLLYDLFLNGHGAL